MQDDCNRSGIAYWHTEHQWPSAMVCVTHERPLVITWDPITPVHRREWLMPGHCPKAALIETPILDDSQIGRLLQLAEFSKCLACSEPGAFDPLQLARTYQARLRNLGLASARGNLKLKQLLDVARGRYSGIESVPGFESLQAIGPDWPGLVATLSRRAPKPGHPLKHLLMIAMLFESWEEFLEAYSNAASHDESPPSVGLSQHNEDSKEEMLYRLVANEGRSIRQAAFCLHISTTTGAQMARRLGIAFTPRPKQMTPERVRRIKRLLRTGASTRNVATQSSVSVGSINRLLAADEHLREVHKMKLYLAKRREARKAFCCWTRTFPGHQVNELRKMPGNPYTWLYRHDRNWLREQIPSLWTASSRVKNV
jgi:hypothetical protein